MERNDDAHHHTGRRAVSVDAHYDMLRNAGYSREKAQEWAGRATDKFLASQEGASAPTVTTSTAASSGRVKRRVPFPWEKPEAG